MVKDRLQSIEDRYRWRGFHKGTQYSKECWRFGSLLPMEDRYYIISEDDFFVSGFNVNYKWLNNYCLVAESSICQYSGREDKNGKDIYEGDILQYDDGTRVVVVYDSNEHTFMLRKKNCDFPIKFHEGRESVLEIIGNIYKNPELLKQ